MSLIDTAGPANAWLAGRAQALHQAAQQRQADQFSQSFGLDQQQQAFREQQAALAAAELARQRREDSQVADVIRAQLSSLVPPAPQLMATNGVPMQGPALPPAPDDGYGDIRGSLQTAPLPVLRAWGEIIPNRMKLEGMKRNLPQLMDQAKFLDPNSSEGITVNHMIDRVRVGDIAGYENDVRDLVRMRGHDEDQAATQVYQLAREDFRAKAKEQEIQAKIAGVSERLQRQHGWPKAKADDQAYLIVNNAQNELPASGMGMSPEKAATLAKSDPDYMRAEFALKMAEKDYEIAAKKDPNMPGTDTEIAAARQAYVDAQKAVVDAYGKAKAKIGGGGTQANAPAASQPHDPETVKSIIKTLTARLGREPTDGEIDSALEGL